MWYILFEGVIISSILMLVYLLLRKYLSAQLNRLSLILVLFLPILLIYLKHFTTSIELSVYKLSVFETKQVLHYLTPLEQQKYFDFSMLQIMVVISTFLLLRLCWKFFKLWQLQHKSKIVQNENKIKVYQIENIECFSFFNSIYINSNFSDSEKQLIIDHEKIHVQLKHSYDLIFAEILKAICWFNPIYYLAKKELILVHENQVDEIMYKNHKVEYIEFLLCYSLRSESNNYLLTNQFFNSKMLIKRINFMKTQSKRINSLLVIIPIIGLGLFLVSMTYTSKLIPNMMTSSEFTKVEDSLDKSPEFNGGEEALIKFLVDNIKYPTEAKEKKIEGLVYVEFIVTKTGKIKDVAIKKGAHDLLNEEALRVISLMPDWIPGEKDGKAVNASMILPIRFKL